MHYSLVSSPVLGFDLVRLPAGDSAAEVLLRALDCGPRELDALAARHDGAAREQAWDVVRDAASTVPEIGDVLHQVADGLAGGDFLDEVAGARLEAGVVRVLQTSTIADADALVRLVHHDVLDWTWSAPMEGGPRLRTEATAAAADVLADAAVSAYLGDRLPDAVRRALVTPYLHAYRDLAATTATRSYDLTLRGAAHTGVEAVLDRLTRLDGTDRACLRAVCDTDRPSAGEWASAVHDASWAVHLSDRTRTAAAAQLLAVRAFRAGGLDAADGAGGVWNVVSGVVHAEVVADLLSSDARAVLLRPWEQAFGRD